MVSLNKKLNFGFLNVDKPQGPTSFSVSEFIKRILEIKKTSHLGTLDPNVSGVLPIALGRACKLTGYLMGKEKKYVGVLHTHKEQRLETLQKIINEKFVGKIIQTPPHKSAVARKPREREVFFWNLIESNEDKKDFLFECKVEAGTYIRKLCSDLGVLVGGAHMDELRRIEAGHFNEQGLYTLNQLDLAIEEFKSGNDKALEGLILSAEDIIKESFVCVDIKKEYVKDLFIGRPLKKIFLKNFSLLKSLKKGDVFAVFSGEKFIEIARFVAEGDTIAKPEFVYN